MPRHHCQRDALLLSASACQFRWSIAAHSGLLDHEHRAAACRTPCALFCVGIRTFASMLQGQEPPADRTLCNRQAGRPQSWSAPDLSAGSFGPVTSTPPDHAPQDACPIVIWTHSSGTRFQRDAGRNDAWISVALIPDVVVSSIISVKVLERSTWSERHCRGRLRISTFECSDVNSSGFISL